MLKKMIKPEIAKKIDEEFKKFLDTLNDEEKDYFYSCYCNN